MDNTTSNNETTLAIGKIFNCQKLDIKKYLYSIEM